MAKKKPGPKPKDRSAYFEEAREISRQFPKLRANAIGDRMQAKYPDVKGLGQAIRKKLRDEELSQRPPATTPTAPSPPSPPASRRRRNPAKSAEIAYMKQLAEQAKLWKLIAEDAVLKQKYLEQSLSDPVLAALLKRLNEDD